MTAFLIDSKIRDNLWTRVITMVEDYIKKINDSKVAAESNPEKIRALLKPFNFAKKIEPLELVDFVVNSLWQHQVHTPHPRYFGLFNPAPTTMSIVADTLVAAFNPQLAAWSHSPFANEMELHLVRAIGSRFGFESPNIDGTFVSGGAEANHTALLTAIVKAFPFYAREGLRGLKKQPIFYVSNQCHHSFIKAARFSGLGTDALHHIAVNHNFELDLDDLVSQISADRKAGFAPFMVVATAGTTNGGIVDPLADIAAVAKDKKLWFHVDAAWGGAAAIVPELRGLLDGIERADSITFDAHKWLSVPMAAGMFITRHKEILNQTCTVNTEYMPREATNLDIIDPFTHSMQWSRRFIGLKVFLSLAAAGWAGYEACIRYQVELGDLLRRQLEKSGWKVINHTRLPVVCFVDHMSAAGKTESFLEKICNQVLSSGKAWISVTRFNPDTPVLRACITNFRTTPEDVIALVDILNESREKVLNTP